MRPVLIQATPPASGALLTSSGKVCKRIRESLAPRKSPPPHLNRRRNQVAHRKLAELFMRERKTCYRARYAYGKPAFVVGGPGVLAIFVEEHPRVRCRGRFFAKIKRSYFAIGFAHQHESAPADIPR